MIDEPTLQGPHDLTRFKLPEDVLDDPSVPSLPEAEADASARGRRVERVLCARLLNEEVRRLELAGQREAALAVRRVVQKLGQWDE